MNNALQTQTISQAIKPFGGEVSTYREWIKDIEKHALLTQVDEATKMIIAYQASTGIVSDFIKRFLDVQDRANRTWPELKRQLAFRFAEVSDPQHALALLQRARQKKGESVPVFAERLHTLAAEAFPDGRDAPAVQQQLIGILTDGLLLDSLKLKLMRENPATFIAAVQLATQEQNLRTKFDLRTKNRYQSTPERHEPMEVDHFRQMKCFKCHKRGHRAKDCRVVSAVGLQSDRGRHIQCWYCQGYGHVQRDCRNRRNQSHQGN